LTNWLREVADDFLIKENKDRPDVLKLLKSPLMFLNNFQAATSCASAQSCRRA